MQIQELAPDLILHNGRFYTLDPSNSVVDAVAIKDGRFLATGAAAAILPLAGAHTQVIDLQGRTVLPGIFDSHNHLLQVGVKLTRIRLDECTSPQEMMELVRARAAEHAARHAGSSAKAGTKATSPPPTRRAGCPHAGTSTPPPTSTRCILMRFFNTDVVNAVALRLAGITRAHARSRRTARSAGTPPANPTASCAPSAKLLANTREPISSVTTKSALWWMRTIR